MEKEREKEKINLPQGREKAGNISLSEQRDDVPHVEEAGGYLPHPARRIRISKKAGANCP